MSNKSKLGRFGFWLVVGCAVLACQTAVPLPPATPTPRPTPTLAVLAEQPPTAVPTPTPVPADTGWVLLQTGLERRQIQLLDANGRPREQLYLLRLDPTTWRLDVGYRPGDPQTLGQWQAQTGAQIVLNGGYFTPEYTATGLTVANGRASGASYEGFGGMVTINEQGTAALRSLAEQPYDPTEQGITAALQSFPLLVKPGGQLGFPADQENGRQARRTVIGQDGDGRILFIIAPTGSFTLHQLSQWLTTSDLQLDIALNLDGGPSTGLLLTNPSEGFPAFSALPTVLLAYPRE